VPLVDELHDVGVAPGSLVALVIAPGLGLALAWENGRRVISSPHPEGLVRELSALDPRWVWWSAWETAGLLIAADVRPRTCWDLGAVGRLAYGIRRGDPGAIWAAARGLPEPAPIGRGLDLLDLDSAGTGPIRPDGQLSREWQAGGWSSELPAALQWARLALAVQNAQETLLRSLPDPRATPGEPPLALLTARSESAAALLAVELEHDGLPVDRASAARLLGELVGPRPANATEHVEQRRRRDQIVLRQFPGLPVDLRNPLHVRGLLTRIGLDLPDTRSWRLEPHRTTSPAVAALLAWRKAERLATTYGWGWLDGHVGNDGRLRGRWGAADAAAGRMTAQAGLHNLPASLRAAVRAEPGWTFVRADLGQVEPRVLAAVCGDEGLMRAARADDLYAPVAAQLGCDRSTAKVAVLAAMYGQTSGVAGVALRDMDRNYPRAMAYLRAAEAAGVAGTDVRTYGGRLLRLTAVPAPAGVAADWEVPGPVRANGRFARNAVVQGAAAELFKAWAATVRDGLPSLGGQVVLCLHDELLLHVPMSCADEAAALLLGSLATTARWWAAGSRVRFVAEVSVATSWADAH